MRNFAWLAALSLVTSVGCVNVPPPPPVGDGGLIGLSVRVHHHRGWLGSLFNPPQKPARVYLIRLDEGVELDTGSWLISSNYWKKGYIYFVNAPPGRYAIVTAKDFSSGATRTGPAGGTSTLDINSTTYARPTYSTTYWPRELIERTLIELPGSSAVFVGEVDLDYVDMDEADDVQAHYFSILGPSSGTAGWFSRWLSSDASRYHLSGVTRSLDQSDDARRAFFDESRNALGDRWEGVLTSSAEQSPSSTPRATGIEGVELGMNGVQVRVALGKPSSVRSHDSIDMYGSLTQRTEWSYEGFGRIVFHRGVRSSASMQRVIRIVHEAE